MLIVILLQIILVISLHVLSIPVQKLPIPAFPISIPVSSSNNNNDISGNVDGDSSSDSSGDSSVKSNNSSDSSSDRPSGGSSSGTTTTFDVTAPTEIPTFTPGNPTPMPSLSPTYKSGPPTPIPSLSSTYKSGPPTPIPSLSPTYKSGPPTPIPSLSPTYKSGPPTPIPSLSPTYNPRSPTPIPSLYPTYEAGSPTPIPSLAPTSSSLIRVDDPRTESIDIDKAGTEQCKKSTNDWISLYLSKGYKSWLIILISIWFSILTYAMYNIYMVLSSQYSKIGGNVFLSKNVFLAFASTMRVIELSILATLKTSSATCAEFSFTKIDYEYNSSQVPFIILTHELFYPSILIIVILRHKLIWIQFKRVIDKNATKNLVTLSVENYGILIGVVFILMDIISFAGPSELINNYSIATQIICPILSTLNQIFKCFEKNPNDIRARIETSNERRMSSAKVFDWIIAIVLVFFTLFAIITTRTFLFVHPLASMLIYSIIMRILELITSILLSFNCIVNSPSASKHSSTSIKNFGEEDESSVSIFVNDNVFSELDFPNKVSKGSVKSSKSHQSINNSIRKDNGKTSGSIKLISSKKSIHSVTSEKSKDNYSPLFANDDYSELYSINLIHSPDDRSDSQKSIRF